VGKVQKFGPQFVFPGRFEVGMYVEGDPEGRVHWAQFEAKSYKVAEFRKVVAYRELAQGAASRILKQSYALQATAEDLLKKFGA
jgi:hypothetical protein